MRMLPPPGPVDHALNALRVHTLRSPRRGEVHRGEFSPPKLGSLCAMLRARAHRADHRVCQSLLCMSRRVLSDSDVLCGGGTHCTVREHRDRTAVVSACPSGRRCFGRAWRTAALEVPTASVGRCVL